MLLGGDDIFVKEVESKLLEAFQYSKIEENDFKYCGSRIRRLENGDIQVDQNDYVDGLKEMEKVSGEMCRNLNSVETSQLRGKIG